MPVHAGTAGPRTRRELCRSSGRSGAAFQGVSSRRLAAPASKEARRGQVMSTDLVSSRIRGVFLLALLLAFGTIGWEHIYHSVILGISVEDSVAGHVAHVLRRSEEHTSELQS